MLSILKVNRLINYILNWNKMYFADEEGASVDEAGSADGMDTSVDEAGSVEKYDADDTGSEGSSEEGDETDYRKLFEEQYKANQNLVSLLGRQGEELGELRKTKKADNDNDVDDVDYTDYFDDDTVKAIDRIVDRKVEQRLSAMNQSQQEKQLQAELVELNKSYDLNEDSIRALGFYVDAYGVSLTDAANELSQKGLLKAKSKNADGSKGVDLKNAPRGATVKGRGGSGTKKYTDMTPDEWSRLSDAEREKAMMEASAL